jgi:hypothetical protein
MLSRAAVEGDEVFPEDVEADEVGAGDVSAGSGAVGIGNAEVSSDFSPGGGVDTGHGLVGGVVEVVLELGGGGFVGEVRNEQETKC